MTNNKEKWYTIDELPNYEINEDGQVRKRKSKKVTTTTLYDCDGKIISEHHSTKDIDEKNLPLHDGKYFVMWHNGKQVCRTKNNLYKKYILGIEPKENYNFKLYE